ncbi:HmuY family protein [Sphingobacterium lumbrici]|uniref:HmuY family protein n=1 Tax=Sphingobacterium lumbrici TaxID=2559600 RepID=UPI00112E49EA|nr:HmuY family protein [Sphingobacterium lumbrici]
MKINKHIKNAALKVKYILFALLFVASASSCDKGSNPKPDDEVVPPDDTTPTDESMFYKLHRVENYQGTQDNDGVNAAPTIFFSLETKKPVEEKYKQTNRWDLAFGGLLNSFVSGNNGSNSTNSGYGNTAKGGITIVEKAFEEVTDIPADAQFKTGGQLIGTDNYGEFGEGIGWYLYDFVGVIVRDGAYENQHVAYALDRPLTLKNGTVVPPRTVIIRTAKGNYAKIKLISLYKDQFEREQWSRSSAKVYFTFEYVLVPAGSTKFEVK